MRPPSFIPAPGVQLIPEGNTQNPRAAGQLGRRHGLSQNGVRQRCRHQRIDVAENGRLLVRQPPEHIQ